MAFGFIRNGVELRALPALFACLVLVPSVAVAGDPAEVLRKLHLQDEAIERIGFRLATANADLCPDGADAGFSIHTLEQYGLAYRAAASSLFALGEPPGVLAVAPGSPAEAIGLREGDALLAVGGQALPAPSTLPAHSDFRRTAAVQSQIVAAERAPSMTLAVLRGGERIEVDLRPVPGCRSLFQVVPDAELKGEADGNYVQVSTEMAGLATSDDGLAALLAHELAHNVLGHRARLDALRVDRGLLAFLGRNARLIRATEREADRLSIYLLARAGYEPEKALGFWTRVRAAAGGSAGDPTHPPWAERLALVRTEADRIENAGVPAREVPLPLDLSAALHRR